MGAITSALLLFEDGVDKGKLARLLMKLRKRKRRNYYEVRTGLSSAEMHTAEAALLDRGIRICDLDDQGGIHDDY